MSVNVVFNGTSYTVPTVGETNWGSQVTALLQDLGANTLPLRGGTVTALKMTAAPVETSVAMPANNIDLNTGTLFTKTISGATTLTVSNVAASGSVSSFILELTNGGSATITWWSGVKWAGGTAPTLTTPGLDSLGFYTNDGGTTWRGVVLAKDVR